MQTIVASTGAQAHERAVAYVLEHGILRTTEDGAATLEAPPLALVVRDPLAVPRSSPFNPVRARMCEQYAHDLLEGTAAQFEYDYHGRLYHHESGDAPLGVDQVAYIVAKLRADPTSRRAVAVTWEPAVDTHRKDVPCLQLVKALVWDGRLEMQTVFRSNDICSALGANLYALAELQRSIAAALDLPVGEYTHVAFSPHVYLSDADALRAFCRGSMEGVRPRDEVCDGCAAAAGCGKRKATRPRIGPKTASS